MQSLFFELIQVSLGNRDMLSRVPTEKEWDALFEAARKQAVAGVCFAGIAKIVANAHQMQVQGSKFKVQSEEDDEEFDESWLEAVNLPEELYYTWMQQAMDIQKRNRLMDKRCVELQKILSDAGFRSCILKGQGVARMYAFQASHQITDDRLQITEGKQLSLETKTEKTPIDSFDSMNLNDEVCISQNINEFSPCENQSPSTSLAVENESIGNKQEINNANDNPNLNDNSTITDNDNLKGKLDLASYRQSGDIDVWVEGGYEKIMKFVNSTFPTKRVNELEIQYDCFNDAVVEIHYHPFFMRNPIKNRRLQQFFESQAESVYFNNVNNNTECGKSFTTPTIEFNLVHLLVHIYHHLMTEGVGLRQVMDYYFCLLAISKNNDNANDNEKALATIKELGLEKFASALMWVIAKVFANDNSTLTLTNNDNNINGNDNPNINNFNDNKSWMLWEPNEEDGRFLLEEIMKSGNFGKQDERQKNLYKNKWNSFWTVHFKTFRFWRFDHWAWFWSPLWRIKSFAWRKLNHYA